MSDKTSDKTSDKRLLPCPFCGGELELSVNGLFYIHEPNECILMDFGIHIEDKDGIRKWNTRPQMDRIVERLKKELLESLNKANDEMIDNGHTLDFEHYFGEKESYEKAIEIVKEEGGLNE